jgi:hypothetical protein
VSAAAAVVVLAAGFGIGTLVNSGSGAAYPKGGDVLAATLHPPGRAGVHSGEAVITTGSQPWVVVTLYHLVAADDVTCDATLSDGRRVVVGNFVVTAGSASWAAMLPVAASSVSSITVSDAGGVLATATIT